VILIWCAAGPAIGVGPLSRCTTLAAALRDIGCRVSLLIEGDASLAGMTERSGVPVQWAGGRAEAWGIVARQSPRLVVTDLLDLTVEDSDELKSLGIQALVHINDSGFGDYRADLVVDTDLISGLPDDQVDAVVLSGGAWHMVRPDVTEARPLRPWFGAGATRVLVILGGADPGYVNETLLDSWPEGLQGSLVLGPALPRSRLADLQSRAAKLDILVAPANLPQIMLAHDLVVTLGGLTSYEAMTLGRPVACVSWAHMAAYVARLAQAGVVVDLGPPQQATEALAGLIKQGPVLTSIAKAGWQAIDGRGAARVAQAIQSLEMAA